MHNININLTTIVQMKRKLLAVFMAFVAIGMMGQTIRFKAAALNVDGLPPKFKIGLIGVDMNPDGPQEAGTAQMSRLIAEKGWAFVGISEDFNYNDELMSAISNHYNSGTWRGEMSIDNGNLLEMLVHTDGLNFLWQKTLDVSGETWVRWNQTYGNLESGYDENIEKGYRYYMVKMAEGIELDVYVLHMDAETNPEDNAARASQITQLADAIIASNNGRPILVLGDTNCRYTRDDLKGLFIDRLNADPRFDVHDPWVDYQWDGVYPALGSASLMVDQYGPQKGEVVDKIFYINNTASNGVTLKANSYLHDIDFSYDDGTPISDHYPVVGDFTIEKVNTGIVTGTYRLQNVGTELYLKPGGWWGTHAMEGVTGSEITFEPLPDGEYTLVTTMGHLSHNNNDPYMDTSVEAAGSWELLPLSEGNRYAFTYMADGQRMALASDGNGMVVCKAYDESDALQQWVIKSEQELKDELYSGTDEMPYNATFLLDGANFDRNDSFNSRWQGEPTIGGLDGDANGNFNAEKYNAKKTGWFDKDVDWDVYQEIDVPNGYYTVSCQAFFRDGDAQTTSSWVNAELYANGAVKDIPSILDYAQSNSLSDEDVKNGSGYIPDSQKSASYYFNAGYYPVSVDVEVTDGKLRLGIRKKDADKNESWTCFDNFQLFYRGRNAEEQAVYARVKAAMDDVNAKVQTLTPEGQAAFDNSTVENRYYNNVILGDGTEEILFCYNALATAARAQKTIGADMTYAIVNNGFELGTTAGWTVTPAYETVIASQSDSRFTTAGGEGEYFFNTWDEPGKACPPLKQFMKLNEGVYELKALVASDQNNVVYLMAGDQHNDGITTHSAGQFVETSMKFIVTGNGIEIGVSGSNNGVFSADGGQWFKADNFRLAYVGDADNAHGYVRVKAAIDDVTAKIQTIDEAYREEFDITDIVNRFESFEIKGDGDEEVKELYAELAQAVKSQCFAGADMTYAIVNNSFETGDLTGWTLPYGNSEDTKVIQPAGTYQTEGADGEYIFNIWWQGKPIMQTVENLPAGKYQLSALYTGESPEISGFYLVANGLASQKFMTVETGKFQDVSTIVNVGQDGKLTICAQGADENGNYNPDKFHFWYKVDNFRLTYLGAELSLDENMSDEIEAGNYATVTMKRSMKAGRWNTFVVPFAMSVPEGWEVKELADETLADDKYLHLRFTDAEAIEAGKPYMVRVSTDVNEIKVENVDVISTTNDVRIGNVHFVGTYEPGNVPVGAYFISNNLFYCAADNTNILKGYRAYITVDGSVEINGIRFVVDDETVTTVDDMKMGEVTDVIGIYNMNGMRLNKMGRGVNILKMSDGSIKRVMIK